MPAVNPTYDLMLMLDTVATDEQRKKVLADAQAMVARDGEIVNEQDWGVRATAYEIRHKTDADYHLLQFHGTPELLRSLHRTLRITDGVLRFRIIKLAPGTPDAPEVQPAPPVAAAAPAPSPAEEAPAPAPAAVAPESSPEPEAAAPEAPPEPEAPAPSAEPVAVAADAPGDDEQPPSA
jgi:small subunit ribosomal protein S6